MTIIDWVNQYSGFIIGLLTLIYVGATIMNLLSNRKLRVQNSNIQKQNVRIQLFEKRYEVYKETEKYFIELMKNDYDSLYLLALSMTSEEKDKVELGLGKVRHLFGTKVYEQTIELQQSASKISRHLNLLSNVYGYITTNMDKDNEFRRTVENIPLGKANDQIKEVCKKFEVQNVSFSYEEPQNYNYYDMYIEKSILTGQFFENYKSLLASMEDELDINYIE